MSMSNGCFQKSKGSLNGKHDKMSFIVTKISTKKQNGSDFSLPLNFGGGQRSRPALAPPLAFVSLRCPDLHSG